jgi:hypothetical protein
MAQAVEHLLCKHEFKPQFHQKKKKKKELKEEIVFTFQLFLMNISTSELLQQAARGNR